MNPNLQTRFDSARISVRRPPPPCADIRSATTEGVNAIVPHNPTLQETTHEAMEIPSREMQPAAQELMALPPSLAGKLRFGIASAQVVSRL